MNLLAMDCSTERAAIALETVTGVYVASVDAPQRHGRDLIPRLSSLLREGGLRARDIDAVAVGVGPGSYTGLRVGLIAAKTLAYANGAGLVGLDSLEVVARNAPAQARRICVIADAQRDELYLADFVREGPTNCLVPTGESHLERLSEWLARLEPGVLVLGPGLESPRVRALLPGTLVVAETASNYPEGNGLIELAREVWATGRRDDPWLIEPNYLRRSAAEEKWEAPGRPGSR
jgi:tRNA threonylcarbamoyladenosine biosynthesis protein TsaB